MPAPTPSFATQLGHVARDIKLSHTVFALPFALLAMFLAAGSIGAWPTGWQFGLIVACMVLARTFAMTLNRWADAAIDAANPRTAGRALPAGRLSRSFMGAVAAGCAILFWLAAAGFDWLGDNPWPMILAPGVLAVVGGYSFMKRFTWLCHVFLGFALAVSPIAAALAIEPAYLARPDVYLLAGMVLCWVAGFDIIYALQDVEADRTLGLYSMPASLGVEPALWISRTLHLIAVGLVLALAIISPQLHLLFALATAAAAALLLVEHGLILRSAQRHLNMAFFTVNGIISLLLGTAGILDITLNH